MQQKNRHQRIFFMLKPDGVALETTIRKMIEPFVTVIACRSFDPVAIDKIGQLYAMHKNKAFYPFLMDYFKGKPIKAYVLNAKKGVKYQRGFFNDFIELVGDTDPAKAKPGTIRKLSSDSLEKSLSEKRALRNLVHRSTTSAEAEKEAAIFFWDHIHDCSKVEGKPRELGKFFAREGEGMFYEERLESSLKKYKLLSSNEKLLCYQDLDSREQSSHVKGSAIVKTLRRGKLSERQISL